MQQTKVLFTPGQVVATPGSLAVMAEWCISPLQLLNRHVAGDWGDLDDMDRMANQHALLTGARLFSSYDLHPGERIWIITEAVGDDGTRSATTFLLPEEY